MLKLFGKSITKNELERKLGDMSQLCGIKVYEFTDGQARGVRAADFRTGTGFDFTVLIDRCMDISLASFKGIPLAWRSFVGEVHPAYYDKEGLEWLRTFGGGLLQTCGLQHAGHPEEDEDGKFGLHDRISTIPARDISICQTWRGGKYIMSIEGRMLYGALYKGNLVLRRRITAVLGEKRLLIEDSVTNVGNSTSPHMIYYHINLGYPLLDKGSELLTRSRGVPADAEAEKDPKNYHRFQDPVRGCQEKCYHHEPEPSQGPYVINALVNRDLSGGLGVYEKYRKNELPYLMEWKMMGIKEYVVGIEPGNCPMKTRKWLKENGLMPYLKPGEQRTYTLEIGLIEGKEEIRRIERIIKK